MGVQGPIVSFVYSFKPRDPKDVRTRIHILQIILFLKSGRQKDACSWKEIPKAGPNPHRHLKYEIYKDGIFVVLRHLGRHVEN